MYANKADRMPILSVYLNKALTNEKSEKSEKAILTPLKVHKIENFFGSEFEFYTISLLVMLKY